MTLMTLAQAHALIQGSTLVGDGARPLTRVHTDTRSLQAGDLFVALKGERFDAHDFVAAAEQQGVGAVMVSRGEIAHGLRVPDTLLALQQLARAWRERFALPLIAVTGSNGKTTVTQMIAGILRAWVGDGALATEGNFNNHIGVPLMLCKLRQDDARWHRAAVLELGMNHVGEVAVLAAMAKPTVALVNNAQREHQEFMVSVEAVARENGSVFEALPASGVAVFPAGDAHAALWQQLAGTRRVLRFALAPTQGADVTARGVWNPVGHWQLTVQTPQGSIDTTLAMPGEHNVRNAAAAASSALAAGAPLAAIGAGLASFQAVKGRMQTQHLEVTTPSGRHAVVLVDDTYNANPDSVRAAIDALQAMPAPRWLVLGDMGEVGHQGAAFHDEVGRYARERGIDTLWCVGELSGHTARGHGAGAKHFATVPDLMRALTASPQTLAEAGAVLVKGSRFMAMERVVQAMAAQANQPASTSPAAKENHPC